MTNDFKPGDRCCYINSDQTVDWGRVVSVNPVSVYYDGYDNDLPETILDTSILVKHGGIHPTTGESLRDPKIPNSIDLILDLDKERK